MCMRLWRSFPVELLQEEPCQEWPCHHLDVVSLVAETLNHTVVASLWGARSRDLAKMYQDFQFIKHNKCVMFSLLSLGIHSWFSLFKNSNNCKFSYSLKFILTPNLCSSCFHDHLQTHTERWKLTYLMHMFPDEVEQSKQTLNKPFWFQFSHCTHTVYFHGLFSVMFLEFCDFFLLVLLFSLQA